MCISGLLSAIFVVIACVIISYYGGGFATVPAYLRDEFGTLEVGAIHGRLLTAWSTAGILGPVLVNYIREFQISRGVAAADAYTSTMYVLVGMLGVGFICNTLVRPVPEELFVVVTSGARPHPPERPAAPPPTSSRQWGLATSAWALTAIPLGWGVFRTLTLASQMFH